MQSGKRLSIVVLEMISPSATVTCPSPWRVSELASGVSDAKCRTSTTDRGGEFKLHQSLHGKYYRLDDIGLDAVLPL